jgi:Trk-type K+ transport system membrane component
MFIGGCAGSTSCSVKIIRHILLGKILWRELEHAYHLSVVRPLRIGGKPVEDAEIVRNVLIYYGLLLTIFVVGWFAHVQTGTSNGARGFHSALEMAKHPARCCCGCGHAVEQPWSIGQSDRRSTVDEREATSCY